MILVFTLLIGCKSDEIIKTERDKKIILNRGEWKNDNDTLNGISVRKNQLGFYKKMTLPAEDICYYTIIDSIEIINNNERKLNEYLKTINVGDTIYHKILELQDSLIILELNDKKTIETFRLKK
ncbi:hypothetical protein SAMN06265371_106223 [Lutibacter agarilyticus]|uniref:Uncharacterized protein n=2 Tax=Lutibacter agarilyticus TaxID=1109740 RepID=A0A238XRA2_9FLAO|nr:hypothetical protein SAMN06265371_106223 [Lutibacter agarilyticus]